KAKGKRRTTSAILFPFTFILLRCAVVASGRPPLAGPQERCCVWRSDAESGWYHGPRLVPGERVVFLFTRIYASGRFGGLQALQETLFHIYAKRILSGRL